MKKIIVLFLLIINATTAEERYTLSQIISHGLEQNFGIKLIKIQQKIAENNLSLGNAGYLPSVDFNLSGTENFINSQMQQVRGGSEESTAGISNPVIGAGLNLDYVLFDGFRISSNYERLEELNEIALLQTKLKIESFISDLSCEYFNLVQQRTRERNLLSAMELSRERLRIVEQRYNIGSSSRLELSQARADFNADSSRLLQQEVAIQQSQFRLNNLISNDSLHTQIMCLDSIVIRNSVLDEDFLHKSLLENNTGLKILQRNNELNRLDIESIKSQNYPIIRLGAGYGYNNSLWNKGTYEWQRSLGLNVGVSLDYNLFNGFNTKRELENARLAQEAKEIEIEELHNKLNSDFLTILDAYRNNLDLLELEKENLEVAHEYYDASIERYLVGDLSGIELRESQLTLIAAEERLLLAEYNAKLAEISIMHICGFITDYME